MNSNPWYEVPVEDLPLLEYNHMFIANLIWLNKGADKDVATFDLVVREMPETWNFYILDGTERFIDLLMNFCYDDKSIETLKKMNLIDSPETEKYYRDFKFNGNVIAMRDGTVFFPGEPIVRITAPLPMANLLTAFMLNVFSYPIRIMTKNVRLKIACRDTLFFGGPLVRLSSFDHGMWSMRSANILGSIIASPIFYKKFDHIEAPAKITGNINHAVIKSFPKERDAYRYVLDNLIEKANFFYVMVDTYDLKIGLQTFIEEMIKTDNFDPAKVMITIDSGNIQEQAFYVREQLDRNNLQGVKIQAMSNLDEYSIDQMLKENTPIDCFIAATAIVNIVDCPKLEAVYKMAELDHPDGSIEYKAKLTKGKESYPGKKQVFRVVDNGFISEDIIGLEDENLGEPLLHQFINNGELIRKPDDIETINNYLTDQLKMLPSYLLSMHHEQPYKVTASEKVISMMDDLKKLHLGNN